MPRKKQLAFDAVLDGVRVRMYITRNEWWAVYNDDDVDDPEANVMCYPKIGTADAWAHQARKEYRASD